MTTINDVIKSPKSKVFRRAYIKRKDATTGLFETSWLDVTDYIKKFGKIKVSIDDIQTSKFKFNNAQITFFNKEGRFNEEDSPASLWYGYAPLKRSLVKIECGFYTETLGSNFIYTRTEYPSIPTIFIGCIGEDLTYNTKGEASFVINSLMDLMAEYPASLLSGFTLTGQTAYKAIYNIRDAQDASGSYIFRPFFGDTTTNWNIDTTTKSYPNLNTSSAQSLREMSSWEMCEKLAEVENKALYIDREGRFNFIDRSPPTTTVVFEFNGNNENLTYGSTIKKISKYNKAVNKYYSRISIKFKEDDTATSYYILENTLTVSGNNDPWNYGIKTYEIDNTWIDTTATAIDIATDLLADMDTVKKEIIFETTLVPHLNVLDRIKINYTSTLTNTDNLWDLSAWDTELIWDPENDIFNIENVEFKLLSIELDLDKLSSIFMAREV